MGNEPILELKGVSKSYGEKSVLEHIDLALSETERLCLRGASGSGKTVLTRIILGLEQPTAGSVFRREGLRLAVVFQEDRLIDHISAVRNLRAVGIEKEKAIRMLDEVGLGADKDKCPREYSGGMKRRLALARALAYGGDLYIFDEPFNGLDKALKERMRSLIDRETAGKALLIISHDDDTASFLGARELTLTRTTCPVT